MMKDKFVALLIILSIIICGGTIHCFIEDYLFDFAPVAAAEEVAPAAAVTAPASPAAPAETQQPPAAKEMTPAQALDLLAQAAASYKGTLQEHMLLRQAIDVLAKAIKVDKK